MARDKTLSLFPDLEQETAAAKAAEFWPTREGWVVRSLFDFVDPPLRFDLCVEMAAGEGAIVRHAVAIEPSARRWVLIELRHPAARAAAAAVAELGIEGEVIVGDFLAGAGLAQAQGATLFISNTPNSLAPEFLLECRRREPSADVALLVPLNFVTTSGRAELLGDIAIDVYPLEKRPSFDGVGTDPREHAWIVAGPGRGGRLFPPIGLRPREARVCGACGCAVRGECGAACDVPAARCLLRRGHKGLCAPACDECHAKATRRDQRALDERDNEIDHLKASLAEVRAERDELRASSMAGWRLTTNGPGKLMLIRPEPAGEPTGANEQRAIESISEPETEGALARADLTWALVRSRQGDCCACGAVNVKLLYVPELPPALMGEDVEACADCFSREQQRRQVLGRRADSTEECDEQRAVRGEDRLRDDLERMWASVPGAPPRPWCGKVIRWRKGEHALAPGADLADKRMIQGHCDLESGHAPPCGRSAWARAAVQYPEQPAIEIIDPSIIPSTDNETSQTEGVRPPNRGPCKVRRSHVPGVGPHRQIVSTRRRVLRPGVLASNEQKEATMDRARSSRGTAAKQGPGTTPDLICDDADHGQNPLANEPYRKPCDQRVTDPPDVATGDGGEGDGRVTDPLNNAKGATHRRGKCGCGCAARRHPADPGRRRGSPLNRGVCDDADACGCTGYKPAGSKGGVQ
jgi:hypothetical protein